MSERADTSHVAQDEQDTAPVTADASDGGLTAALWAPVTVAELEDASSALVHEGRQLERDAPDAAGACLRAADYIDQAVDVLNEVGHA